MPDQGVGQAIEIGGESGCPGEAAHQQEQWYDGQGVVRNNTRRLDAEQRDRRPPAHHQPDTDEARQPHGDSNRHVERNQDEHAPDTEKAEDEWIHGYNASVTRCSPSTSSSRSGATNPPGPLPVTAR